MVVFIVFIAMLILAVILAVLAIVFKKARKVLLIISVCVIAFAIYLPNDIYGREENELMDKFAQNDWSDKEKVKNAGFEFSDDNNSATFGSGEGENDLLLISVHYTQDSYQQNYDSCNIVRERYRYFLHERTHLNQFYYPQYTNINFAITTDTGVTIVGMCYFEGNTPNRLYEYIENTNC